MEVPVPPESQREVQRLHGRCLLRLQQYEKLFKWLLAHREVSVTAEGGQLRVDVPYKSVHSDTLGMLARTFSESYLKLDGAPDAEGDTPAAAVSTLTIRTRMGMEVSEEVFAGLTSELKVLVGLRNELVHHLIDRFDLGSEQGCADAIQHLEASYGQIDVRFAELQGWVRSQQEVAAHQAAFLQSAEFEDFLFNGIDPDGEVDWSNAGIVRALRRASQALAGGDWARLDKAVAWIDRHEAEQTPGKYRCKSWPDVLDKSRAFDHEYRIDEAGRKAGWYRPRP
jgi:hypothetical protein